MTIPNLKDDPDAASFLLQTALKQLGYYKGNIDNIAGPKTEAAYDAFCKDRDAQQQAGVKTGKASSFADEKDVGRFRQCKAQGKSDQQCFKVGDNGIGRWGDKTSVTNQVMCALIPEDIEERWGSVNAGKGKIVEVTANGNTFKARLADILPRRNRVKHGVIIDLNPGAQKVLDLKPPFLINASWRWLDDVNK